MKIITIARQPSSHRYGAERSQLQLFRGLAQRGHDVTLLYLEDGNLLEEYSKFCKHIAKISFHRVERRRWWPKRLFQFAADLKSIPKADADIIHSNQIFRLPYARLLGSALGLPIVNHHRDPFHGSLDHDLAWGLKKVRHHVFTSNAMCNLWQKGVQLKKEHSDVVYNGIDTNSFCLADDEAEIRKKFDLSTDEKVVLFVGRLDQTKGVEVLINGFEKAHQKRSDLRLWIVGQHSIDDKNYEDSLKQMVKQKGLENVTRFFGNQIDVCEYYQVSALSVVPSVFFEPFGRVVVESLACGTPVIVSHVGGMPEILGDEFREWSFEKGNDAALSERILEVVDQKVLDKNLSRRCHQYVEDRFSLKATVDQMEGIFEKIIGGG